MLLKIIINDGKEIEQKTVDYLFDCISDHYQVITNSKNLHQKLKNLGIKSNSLDEIFVVDAPVTIQIDNIVSHKMDEYKKKFENIKFRNFMIFPSIQNQLINSLTLLFKIEKILDQNVKTIFIFEKFYLELLVLEENFQNNDLKLEFLDSNLKKINLIQNFSKYKKSSNLKYIKWIFKIPQIQNQILKYLTKKINKKISFKEFAKNSSLGIFLTPSSDYVYEPFLLLEKKLKKNNYPFKVISFDMETPKILESKKVDLIDFSKETWLISQLLQQSSEYKIFINNIKNSFFENDIKILKINHTIFQQLPFLISIMIVTEIILINENFKSILVHSDGDKIGNSVITISDFHNISSVSIPSLTISSTPIHRFFLNSKKICLYGEHARNTLLELEYDPQRLILTGNPKYDYIQNSDKSKSKSLLSKIYSTSNKKIILLGLTRWGKTDEIWMSELIKFCNENNFCIIIKVHPIYKNTMQEIHSSKIELIKNNCPGMKYLITYDIDPSLLLQSCDLIISDHSNFLIEGILLKKRCLCVNFNNENLEFIKQSLSMPQINFISNFSDLIKSIRTIISNDSDFILYDRSLYSWALQFNYLNDGNSVERIFKTLNE
jgi:hypothetical protein